jgi:hypothetical protein
VGRRRATFQSRPRARVFPRQRRADQQSRPAVLLAVAALIVAVGVGGVVLASHLFG